MMSRDWNTLNHACHRMSLNQINECFRSIFGDSSVNSVSRKYDDLYTSLTM